jgi:DNA gyrase inhibitor GyrI
MNLTEIPETVDWPKTHYAFVERIGPFQTYAHQAWQDLHRVVAEIEEHNQITGYLSLYKIGPEIYRAGVALAAPPTKLPQNLSYMEFGGGKFSRFVLTGPYSGLGEATSRVMQIVAERKFPLRDEFSIENYVNDPRKTPEEQLITEILVPTI